MTGSAPVHFVNALRVRPEVLRLASPGAPATWTLRVQAAEAWDAVRVECTPDTLVRDVKTAAMANLLPDMSQPDGYMVKLHGAEVRDENLSLQRAGARDASTLFLTSRRRRPLK